MDPEERQQAPQTPKSRRKLLKPRKFRMSCDCCAVSKVKCDQARPTCHRCFKLGVSCHYSPSQRMGKRPAATRRQFLSTASERQYSTSRSVSPLPDLDLDASSQGDWSSDNTQSSCNSSVYMGTPSNTLLDAPFTLGQGYRRNSVWSKKSTPWEVCADPAINAKSTTNTLSTTTSAYPNYSWALDGHDTTPLGYLSVPTNIQRSTGCSVTQSIDHQTTGHQELTCAAIVQTALQNLTLESATSATLPICSRTSTTRDPHPTCTSSMDSSLTTIKRTVELITSVLDCNCLCSGQLNMSMFTVVDKILSRYHEIVYASDSNSQNNSGANDNTGTPIGALMTLGSYNLDPDDQQSILMHVVASDLRRAVSVAQQFISKHLLNVSRDSANGELVSAIIKYLQDRITQSLEEVTKILQTLLGFTGHVLVHEGSMTGLQNHPKMSHAWT